MNAPPIKVLVIDDEPPIRKLLRMGLSTQGYEILEAPSGKVALELLAQNPALVILDLGLPDIGGHDLLRTIRSRNESVPIVVLSSRGDEAGKVQALDLGADDYITKPFSPRELLARVRAVLRRYKTAREVLPARNEKRRAYRFAGWELNLRTRRLTGAGNKRVELSNGEFSLLEAFCAAPQRVLSREQLLDLSRLHNAEVYDRSIDVQILRLRRKIEANASAPEYIKTERGAGYIFDTPVEILH